MNCEILIRSYARDKEWCDYALRSIKKFCRGFSGVTVLVADYDEVHFGGVVRFQTADGAPVRLRTYRGNRSKPMLTCMAELCYADEYCPEADLILHTDSDCVFKVPVTPETYMTDGKPQLLVRTFESLKGQPPYCWKEPTSKALGFEAKYEVMVRHPAVHYRQVYHSLRDHIASVHPEGFPEYVTSLPEKFPWGFAEFPALGLWAYLYFEDKYHVIDVSGVSEEEIARLYKTTLYQGWNHQGNDPAGRADVFKQRRAFEFIVS